MINYNGETEDRYKKYGFRDDNDLIFSEMTAFNITLSSPYQSSLANKAFSNMLHFVSHVAAEL